MKLAVVAANGRSGQAFVAAALAAGHDVTAGVHGTSPFTGQPRLRVVPCDATNPEQLQSLIAGQDAVVSLIGHVKDSPATIQTDAIRQILAAMHTCGVRRLVSLTGTGVRIAGDHITLLDRLLNTAVNLVDPARVNDGIEHVAVLRESSVDWTIIRILKLQDVAARPFSLKEHGPTKPFVGRAEVAQAILQVLEQGSFIRQAPIVGVA